MKKGHIPRFILGCFLQYFPATRLCIYTHFISTQSSFITKQSASPIPNSRTPWLLGEDDLVDKFNSFIYESIRILSTGAKLSSHEQALSLNGIILIYANSCGNYEYEPSMWEELCIKASRIHTNRYHIPFDTTNNDLSILYGVLGQFKDYYRNRLSTIAQFTDLLIIIYSTEDCSPMILNTFKMLANLKDVINYNWDSTRMTEDSFTKNVVDPIFKWTAVCKCSWFRPPVV